MLSDRPAPATLVVPPPPLPPLVPPPLPPPLVPLPPGPMGAPLAARPLAEVPVIPEADSLALVGLGLGLMALLAALRRVGRDR